jgi:hypothetical protein
MNWRFVQHDLRRMPLPFADNEFDLVMIKDLSLTMPATGLQQRVNDEYFRILKPGGTVEIWEGDHPLRVLLPHELPSTKAAGDGGVDEVQMHANAMGTYVLTARTPWTPLAAAHNQFIQDYNSWISIVLESRRLSPMPCTQIRPILLQESENLTDVDCRRLAIPLGEVRWEREGIGGVTTHGTIGIDHAAVSSTGKGKESEAKGLTEEQADLRRTALTIFVQMIESLEPVLREASGKGQDEWDRWYGNMMNDLLEHNGTSWGECLEVCAGWARKKTAP